ncbi:MAG: DMT family transporter [Prevotella sp.]|nr:DMT family transporter [Prevotella sp.]
MAYLGELISLGVAFLWTISALSGEVASRRLGVFVMNVWRMAFALCFSALLIGFGTGWFFPAYASGEAWFWLLLSGVVGYFFGDWCLFNSYLTIGSRYGQLFMTLAPAFAAFSAWTMLGQTLSWQSLLAMAVTLTGIAISVLGRGEGHKLTLDLPAKGVLFGLGAALGQGVGLVLSKIGLDCYEACVPSDLLPQMENYLPFGSNMIRCVAGLVCYSLWLMAMNLRRPKEERQTLRASLSNRKGFLAMLVLVVSGPFLGVGFSLMALRYTAAGIASTLMATTPIIILLPSRWLFGQRITVRAVLGAVISVVGVSLFFL